VENKDVKKYAQPIALFAVFETVAIVLWLTKGNLFYLLNFSYIGTSVALGVGLLIQGNKNARKVTQLLKCGKCRRVCPMDVDMLDDSRSRKNGTECILCFECAKNCPKKAL